MEPFDKAIISLILSLPEKWAEYIWDDFTSTEQKVLVRLITAGFAEQRILLRARMAGFNYSIQFQVLQRGDHTKNQLRQAIFKAMPDEWLDRKGRTKGRYQCELLNEIQVRLTDQGTLAKHDYESQEPSYILELAKTCREHGVVYICSGLTRVIDGDEGSVEGVSAKSKNYVVQETGASGKQSHQQFLYDIKNKVHSYAGDKKFIAFVQDFLDRYSQWFVKLNEFKEYAKTNPEVRVKDVENAGKPPQKGWEIELEETLDDSPRAFWRPPLPPNPIDVLLPDVLEYALPEDETTSTRKAVDVSEEMAAKCFLLAVIYDKLSDDSEIVDPEFYPLEDVWGFYGELCQRAEYHRGEKIRSKIREALCEVQECIVLGKTISETEQGDKDTKREQEGKVEPKPPEIIQNILWLKKYGRKYWKLVVVAVLLSCIGWGLPKITSFSKKHQKNNSEAKTDSCVKSLLRRL